VRDQHGFLVISSNNGLQVIHEKDLVAYLTDQVDYLVPYYVGIQSGVFNTEFNGGFLNNHINVNGSVIYFPSAQGIVFYFSRPIEAKKTKVVLEGVFADGEKSGFPVEFARTTKQIRFDFFSVTYNEFDNVFYQYRLEEIGKSAEWSEPSRSTTVLFDLLPPGEYVFEVRAINGSNDPNPETLRYTFKIPPYFYERPLVQIGIFFIFLLLVLLIVYRRNQQRQEKIKRELEVKNTITELELDAIHSQMNPHLIFNSLNVLMHLIRTKSFEKAEHFTVEFAQLLRNILEGSGAHFLEVVREIDLLENYLRIQEIRFRDEISYRIECDPSIYSKQIPAMLVQPLVENAIVHGLSHTVDRGNLVIRFEETSDFLRISVEDDGIGRAQSAKIQQGKKRRSMGMALIQKKIDLMKSKYGVSIALDLEDLREGERPGTKAVLTIFRSVSQEVVDTL
jgi:hypothetical protein